MPRTAAALVSSPLLGTTEQAANADDGRALLASLKEEIADLEPVVGAAMLVVTAFRLRDEEGLIATLRGLTEAVIHLERRRAEG
jgi:hypothetical protein